MAFNNGMMGMQFGLEASTMCFKRKFRWLLHIEGVSADSGVNSLPPLKSARPNISFKEMEVQHMTETVYFPAKPEWKPITLTLYDLKKKKHPVFEWLKNIYDPNIVGLEKNPDIGFPSNTPAGQGSWKAFDTSYKKTAKLELYNGCGDVIETWVYENAWPQAVEFGELDMGNSEYVTAEITLRYDRAYIEEDDAIGQ